MRPLLKQRKLITFVVVPFLRRIVCSSGQREREREFKNSRAGKCVTFPIQNEEQQHEEEKEDKDHHRGRATSSPRDKGEEKKRRKPEEQQQRSRYREFSLFIFFFFFFFFFSRSGNTVRERRGNLPRVLRGVY